jgi:hypothetical protein
MGSRRRQENTTLQKTNNSTENSVENEENDTYWNDDISMFSELSDVHKEILKEELKMELIARHLLFKPVIPATEQAEIRSIGVPSQPSQIVYETQSLKYPSQKSPSVVVQDVGPEFKIPVLQKQINKQNKKLLTREIMKALLKKFKENTQKQLKGYPDHTNKKT